jgi:hypothetical protein
MVDPRHVTAAANHHPATPARDTAGLIDQLQLVDAQLRELVAATFARWDTAGPGAAYHALDVNGRPVLADILAARATTLAALATLTTTGRNHP